MTMSTVYEQFVREVYQALVNQSDVKNVQVQHNVVLVGKSGATHQIDVFWEFEAAGQRYRTCVECKHWSSPVKKSHIASFAGILADIGNANGIFVTTESYQQGAKLFAQHSNIRLVLMVPTIREVGMEMILQIPDYRDFKFEFDTEAVRAVLASQGLTRYQYQTNGRDAVLRDNLSAELLDLTKALGRPPEAGPARVDLSGYSLQSDVGWLPLIAATFDMHYGEHRESFTVNADDAVLAILEDVLENRKYYVDTEGHKTDAGSQGSDEDE